LQYTEIKQIIRNKINESSSNKYNIELLDDAIDHLAGPSHVDYMELKMSGQKDNASFIFATRGGHDLVYKSIRDSVGERLEGDVFHHDGEFVRVNYFDDKWRMELCTRNDESIDEVTCIDRGTLQV
jgi:hypothetical protein